MNTIGERIKYIRKSAGLTQAEFGEIIGVTGAHISKSEKGLDSPSVSLSMLISIKFNIPEEWLINGGDIPPTVYFGESSNRTDKYGRHMEICKHLNEVYRAKNTAYGDAFGKTFKKLGIISAVTRMTDKWNRIEALALGAKNDVADENLTDTLLDMANYCLMTLIEMEDGNNG